MFILGNLQLESKGGIFSKEIRNPDLEVGLNLARSQPLLLLLYNASLRSFFETIHFIHIQEFTIKVSTINYDLKFIDLILLHNV